MIVRPSFHVSYDTLKHWLDSHPEIKTVMVLGQDQAEQIKIVLLPRTVRSVLQTQRQQDSSVSSANWRSYLALVNRFANVIILCVSDEEVVEGYTVYRIISKFLLSDKIILIGPTVSKAWPGGHDFFTSENLREMAVLVAAAGLGLLTTAGAFAVIAFQEAIMRMGIQKR